MGGNGGTHASVKVYQVVAWMKGEQGGAHGVWYGAGNVGRGGHQDGTPEKVLEMTVKDQWKPPVRNFTKKATRAAVHHDSGISGCSVELEKTEHKVHLFWKKMEQMQTEVEGKKTLDKMDTTKKIAVLDASFSYDVKDGHGWKGDVNLRDGESRDAVAVGDGRCVIEAGDWRVRNTPLEVEMDTL